jgi:hypothetical protein
MSQQRLSPLFTLPNENTIAQNLDFSELLKTFADLKARNSTFIEEFSKYLYFHILHCFYS